MNNDWTARIEQLESRNKALEAVNAELVADRESLLKMLRLTLDQWKKMNASAIAKHEGEL